MGFHMITRAIATLLLVGIAVGGFLVAQQTSGVTLPLPPEPMRISIGQSLESVVAILRKQGLEPREGGFEFSQGDPDQSYLHFTLDEDHTVACAFFSRSRQSITGLSMLFFPSRTAQFKANQSWISASSIVLYPDTTYAVHFLKPLTPDQLRAAEASRPKSQYPGSPPN